jgi:hypothetical protein
MRATAPLRGSSRYPTSRIAADRMSAATAVRTAAGVESATTPGARSAATAVGAPTAVRTTTVKSPATMGTVPTATGVGTAAAMRATAVRTAAAGTTVRSSMLSERRVWSESECERYNRCKQETYG